MQPAIDCASALRTAVIRRDQAVACAILSIGISLALVTGTFLGNRRALKAANEQVLDLQEQLRDCQAAAVSTQKAIIQTQQALVETQRALEQARAGSVRR